jgi:cytochrome c-type protein NapC
MHLGPAESFTVATLGKRHYTGKVLALAGAFVVGIVFWGGFNFAMELTNSEAFCISCHEMRDNVYQEYRRSAHFLNRTGVRASCPDCHVPRDWPHMVQRKIRASNELYHWLIGSIDSREKFRKRRLHLAKIVWRDMQSSDSRECRNCHHMDFMAINEQSKGAAQRHRGAKGKSCIDCHKGIAHTLPDEFLRDEHERFERDKVACADCHVGLTDAASGASWY